jgi:hypothetical protein
MNTRNFGTQVIVASLVAASSLGCGSASAMGRNLSTPAASAPAGAVNSSSLGGDYADGYSFGERNATLLIHRLRQRTVDAQGCGAVDQLESSLVRVVGTVKPPFARDLYVAGFYSGYIDAIRITLSDVRHSCGASRYESGEFAGQLFGTIACQTRSISADAASRLVFQPLYSGWSGGSQTVQADCASALHRTVEACAEGTDLGSSLEAAIQSGCSDTGRL